MLGQSMAVEEMARAAGNPAEESPSHALHVRCGDGLEAYDVLTGDVGSGTHEEGKERGDPLFQGDGRL